MSAATRIAVMFATAHLLVACADSPDARSPTPATEQTGGDATSSTVVAREPTPPTTDRAAVSSTPAEVRLDHYAIEPTAVTAPAGTVVLTALNADRVPHDVVVLRTSLAADQLPTTDVRVDESDPAIEILGRTPRLSAGATGSLTATLPAGTYILVCTVPHHYVREAMVATLTVAG